MRDQMEIISFYEFKDMSSVGPLVDLRAALKELLTDIDVRGTIIIADEGFNGMVCGEPSNIARFVTEAGSLFKTRLVVKSSLHDQAPFRRIDVKVKPEIVTLKRQVNIGLGQGTHVTPEHWNDLISDEGTLVLDTRNDYEYRTGTFRGAVNPAVTRFSELPAYVADHLDPASQKRVAMFCTGGIRCEKFAPYLKQLGFEEVYQLEGGILKYLESVPADKSLWQGECFVFDERVSVDHGLRKGVEEDHSQRLQSRKKQEYRPE